MGSNSHKKEKINRRTVTSPPGDEDNIISEGEISNPKSFITEDDENSSS